MGSYSKVLIEFTMEVKILLILLFASYVKADIENCNAIGECQNAQISHLVTVASQLQCLELCKSEMDCKWYTYSFHLDEEEFNCVLYSTCESLVNDNDDYYPKQCVSGRKNCPTNFCGIDGFCLGTLIKSFPSIKDHTYARHDCHSACKDEPGCKFFSFSPEIDQNCYLFQDCPSIDETYSVFESTQVGVGCPEY